jgi:hypothetical protein
VLALLQLVGSQTPTPIPTANPTAEYDTTWHKSYGNPGTDLFCAEHSKCSGHGTCSDDITRTCTCFDGWGSANDVTAFRSANCGARVCPSGRAWADIPTSATAAHAAAECSNMGACNRRTGTCTCFEGFTGEACQRLACPSLNSNACSGHGTCVSMKRMATMTNALPLSSATTYTGSDDTTTWDEDKVYGCVCGSQWTVGLTSGTTQQAEWFGPDCSLRRCPSADDPTTLTVDETDCYQKVAAQGFGTGQQHNLCHVDCANRGTCDYATGTCKCGYGYYGKACEAFTANAGSYAEKLRQEMCVRFLV